MNIFKEILEPKQSIDNRMQKITDTYSIDCDYFNKLLW